MGPEGPYPNRIGFFVLRLLRMKIRLNGQEYETKAKTVGQLLEELQIHPQRVAVEVNLQIVKRAQYDEFRIKEGDTVEVVHFVGGG